MCLWQYSIERERAVHGKAYCIFVVFSYGNARKYQIGISKTKRRFISARVAKYNANLRKLLTLQNDLGHQN